MLKRTLTTAAALLGIAFAPPLAVQLHAQGPAPASVHGHVNDAAGTPLAGVDVKFTTDKTSENLNSFNFPK